MSRSRKRSKLEEIMWVTAGIVFVLVFTMNFIYRFFANCIFEWPIRWDVKVCWNEQITPAKEKASEAAINFIP